MSIEALLAMFSSGAPSLDAAFVDLDRRARALQARYRRVVQLAVWGGFLSLVFSFAAICFGPSVGFVIGELVALAVMMAGIGLGLARRYHEHWILERHRAERLRLLRYAWLIEPEHWDQPADAQPALARGLQERVETVMTLSEADMKRWRRDAPWPDVTLPADRPIAAAFVNAVRRHYLSHRLDHQLGYFLEMADRRERLDAITRILPAVGFGVAIVLSVVHLVGELAGGAAVSAPGGWLLFLILVLPTAGTAARLLRTAFEFARNRQRFAVTAAELERTRGRLEDGSDPLRVARALARAEFALENEHRAWLQLMAEAEWFG